MVKICVEIKEANGNGKDIITAKGDTVMEAFKLASHRVQCIYNFEGGWLFVYLILALGASGVLGAAEWLQLNNLHIAYVAFVAWVATIAFIFLLFWGDRDGI